MTFRSHFWQPNLPPWPFANWTAKSSRSSKSLFKPHLGSQAKRLINRGWSLMRRHWFFLCLFRPNRISSGCLCVCVLKVALTNEGCWFLSVCFWRQLSPRCSLRVSLKRRRLGNNLRKHIVWPQHFGWLKIHPAQLWQSVSLSSSSPVLFFFCAGLWFGPSNLFNTESTKATVSWLTLYVKVDTKKRGSVAD